MNVFDSNSILNFELEKTIDPLDEWFIPQSSPEQLIQHKDASSLSEDIDNWLRDVSDENFNPHPNQNFAHNYQQSKKLDNYRVESTSEQNDVHFYQQNQPEELHDSYMRSTGYYPQYSEQQLAPSFSSGVDDFYQPFHYTKPVGREISEKRMKKIRERYDFMVKHQKRKPLGTRNQQYTPPAPFLFPVKAMTRPSVSSKCASLPNTHYQCTPGSQ
uniref:Uncharacterized protein n=1 Tax=Caenorhabditis japonica TaxID=281687 RepID=A0A8R1E3C4_CAEJA